MADNIRFVVGDKVKFNLTPRADFHKGNHFIGVIVGIKAAIFSVVIKPSASSSVKLSSMLNSGGLITVQFRCCRIYNQELAKALRAEMHQKKLNAASKAQIKRVKSKKGWAYSGGKL